jgi:hypothetical protein
MPSKLKSETARLNGAKSRGPKTAEGRAKSSRNAFKHGFTSNASNAIVLDCENAAEFKLILDDFIATHKPDTPAEKDLVEEMVASRWRIRRLRTIDSSLLNDEMLGQRSKVKSLNPSARLARAFRALADDSHALSLVARYESRLQRTYDRAYRTLRELQQLRKGPNEPTEITVKWVDPKPDNPARVPPATPPISPLWGGHSCPQPASAGPLPSQKPSLERLFRSCLSFVRSRLRNPFRLLTPCRGAA